MAHEKAGPKARVDRIAVFDRLRTALVRSPTLVRLAKDIYRNPTVSRSKPYQWFVRRRAAAADAAIHHTPPTVAIETVLTCNARCTMCVHSEKKMVGVMDLGLFRRLIDECVEWGIEEVGLSVYGEPLIDKHWRERLEIVRAAGLRFSFFSNASMLTEELAEFMLDIGGWTEVNFSVNGFSKDVYEKVMPPLKRDRVYGNLDKFLALKLARGVDTPKVTVSCVTLEETFPELDEYRRYWSSKPGVDRVSIADRSDWLGELKKKDAARPVGRRLRLLADESWKPPCALVWSSMFVYADGRVAPCCEDAGRRELIIGDVTEASLRDVYFGEPMRKLRAEHLADRRSAHPECGQCHVSWPWI